MLVRFFAAAKAAFGAPETELEAGTVAEALTLAVASATGRDASEASRVFARCSFLVDGVATRDPATRLDGATLLDVLPPFAGG